MSERCYLEDLGVDGKYIEMYLQEVGWKGREWIVIGENEGFV